MTLKTTVILSFGTNIYYLCMLVCGEFLCHIYMFYAEVGITTSNNLNFIILDLYAYFFLLMIFQNKIVH